MAAISQTIFSEAFSWMKSFVFWFKFNWSLFLRVQLAINQHCLAPIPRQAIIWTNSEPIPWRIYAALGGEQLTWPSKVMMTSSNGNIFRVTGHMCGEFTGPADFPTQRSVMWSFDVFFALRQNKRLGKQWWCWWFKTLSRPLWHHCYI